MKTSICILFFLLFSINTRAADPIFDEAWNEANSPSHLNVKRSKLEGLAKEGILAEENYPWSDGYWPLYAGGISQRWLNQKVTSKHYLDYLYPLLSIEQIKNYVTTGKPLPVAVEFLSPAEKYDLYVGNYSFPNVVSERNWIKASIDPHFGNVPSWMGWCDGWSAAALSEPEPGPIALVTNKDGIVIPFFTSDINALMTKIYSEISPEWTRTGAICKTTTDAIKYSADGRVEQDECRDVNPGVLHLLFTQYLGNANVSERKGFIADIDFSYEIWNQPVVGYRVLEQIVTDYDPKTDKRNAFRAKGTTALAYLKTQMLYVEEIAFHKEPTISKKAEYTKTINLEYTLELDKDGFIIGGEWLNNEFPDFVWAPYGTVTGNERLNYSVVKKLLEISRRRH